MKKLVIYTLLILLFLMVVAGGIYYWKKSRNLSNLLSSKSSSLMQSNLLLGRAKTKIGSTQELINNLSSKIQKEVEEREGLLTQYAELEALYTAERRKVRTITKIHYKDRVVDLPKGSVYYRTPGGKYEEIKTLKYNYKDFRITISGDAITGVLDYKLHQKFRLKFIESKVPGGVVNHYAELFEIDQHGKDLGKLELTKFTVVRVEDYPNKMMWWNPKLDLVVGGGFSWENTSGLWFGEVGLSIMGYGKTSDDLTWRFLRVGVGVSGDNLSTTFSPVQFNLGKYLPLVSNVWLSPVIGYHFSGSSLFIGLGIGVVL